jgi:UDP-GlcNAc:undecaprenyl-phosphate GlcNAc-1-phosphate transferase
MSDNYFFALIITFILGINFQNTFRKAAKHIGLVDKSGERKTPDRKIPLSGGIAMFLSLAFTALLLNESINELRPLFSGMLIMLVAGVMGDLQEMKTSQRFLLQLLAAFIAYQWGGVQLIDLGKLLAEGKTLELRNFSLPITVLTIVGIINTVKMLDRVDGADGLAGSIALVITFLLAMVALGAGNISAFQILGLVSVALVTFLFFNWRFYVNQKALLYMGDAGSLLLGFVIAYFLIKFSQGENRLLAPVTALWIFGYPVIDGMTMIIRRLLKGRSPFTRDRDHFHHLLQSAHVDLNTTTFILVFISTLCAATGMLGEHYQISQHIMFYGFIITFVCYFIIIHIIKGVGVN